ncbi:hypothetical protein IU436_28920 [Nocardia farcinica]|uniref:hypothetical protein n=1 Tax=Nocardia farcinica TaxID=37329 RepID=UPI001894CFFE|nr:hypothetical protein [Nocardia farcinica]MBF6422660.1 hypothetical protein [Nocardia farcinica]MBF6434350.1 hypothetical protein [Nocardia farcinica]MBF6505435.1 hypothetical protein [Nocardia farcinica]
MQGSYQGSALPSSALFEREELAETHTETPIATAHVVLADHADSGHEPVSPAAVRHRAATRTTDRRWRRRIAFADADAVRRRVQDAAATAGISAARDVVLRAVLKLLCGWSRIHDDRVRIQQIIDLCGPDHQYDPKTVGRALAALQNAEFISYAPARGRGRHATVAIHSRFLEGIEELDRDEHGRVVVTFSRRRPYMSQRNHPPTPADSTSTRRRRPTEVKVHPADVRRVLTEAPEPFQQLPRHLRWCLGREIRTYLSRGFTPGQILAVLAAPMPDRVDRPLRLAKWRLAHNMIGSGPRLAPLQRAWDAAQHAAANTRLHAEQRRVADELLAATDAATRRRMLDALRTKLTDAAVIDETPALVHAARMARRENPGLPLTRAIARWLADHLPHPAPAPVDIPAVEQPGEQDCVSCGASGAQVREALPLQSAVCDSCWAHAGLDDE